jgi:hypothetical protein
LGPPKHELLLFAGAVISAKIAVVEREPRAAETGIGRDHINECPARRPGTLERDERCLAASIGT